jgi:hypothetical protein
MGLTRAVREAVDIAGGITPPPGDKDYDAVKTKAEKARNWFISNYPLLGAIAASFKIIENQTTCTQMDIHVAAVSSPLKEIYINPSSALTEMEYRFVIAHELLHAALRHDVRHDWRDAYLCNVACDFVINLCLTEMNVGERPPACLYDEQFKGLSAEAVYDIIVTNMRLYRKLATLRGVGLGDILPNEERFWNGPAGIDLDGFYRRSLMEGLDYTQSIGRGLYRRVLLKR